jgi:hypothetical protein
MAEAHTVSSCLRRILGVLIKVLHPILKLLRVFRRDYLPFRKHSFDTVLMAEVIDHLPKESKYKILSNRAHVNKL